MSDSPVVARIALALGLIWLAGTVATLGERLSFLLDFLPYEYAVNYVEWHQYALNVACALTFLGIGLWLTKRRGLE